MCVRVGLQVDLWFPYMRFSQEGSDASEASGLFLLLILHPFGILRGAIALHHADPEGTVLKGFEHLL